MDVNDAWVAAWRALARILLAALLIALAQPATAEDGHDLWLRYRPLTTRCG